MAASFAARARLAERAYKGLHDGLAPLRIEAVELERDGLRDRVVAELGRAPEFRYEKRHAPRGRPRLDLFRHFSQEHDQKRQGLAAVLARCPAWGVTAGGKLVILHQRFTHVTDHGIEDRPDGLPKTVLADGRPPAPEYLVALGPLPEFRFVDPQGRVRRHVFFAGLEDRPAVRLPLLPVLAHDGRGNLFLVRQQHLRVHRDGSVEETTMKVPLANPHKNPSKATKSTSSSREIQRARPQTVVSHPVEPPAEFAKNYGTSVAAAFAGVVASGLALRGTSLTTTERGLASSATMGIAAFLLRNKYPNLGRGLGLGAVGAAAIPLYDSARVAMQGATGGAQQTQTQQQTTQQIAGSTPGATGAGAQQGATQGATA